MTNRISLSAIVLLCSAAWAQQVSTAPANQPVATGAATAPSSAPTTAPAATASAPSTATSPTGAAQDLTKAADKAALAVLERLELAGQKTPIMVADLEFHVDMLQTGDTEERGGKVYAHMAQGDQPTRFRIHFDWIRQGKGGKLAAVEDFVFDGEWFTVRKDKIKQMIKYQVAPPGKAVNPLEIGKGPFLFPFGQKADQVVRFFVPKLVPPAAGDPPDTDHIRLDLRPARKEEMSVVWLEMWVDKQGLPVKIKAEDKSENVTTVQFKNVQTPEKLPADTFVLPVPAREWEYRVEPFRGQIQR